MVDKWYWMKMFWMVWFWLVFLVCVSKIIMLVVGG